MSPSRLLFVLLVPLLVMPSGAQHVAPMALRASDAEPMPFAPRTATPFAAAADTLSELIREPSRMGTIVGGVVGGALGTFAGLALAERSTRGCHGELCGLEEALVGILIGEPLGMAIGAHIGSGTGRHERVIMTSLASMGILAGGVLAGVGLSHMGAGAIMIPLTPILQLATVVAIEAP
jgi:uncharacterized membrane protein YoaK (UPF0700 family)